MPSAYEEGKAAIMAAMTAAEAQDAYDDIDPTMITAQEAMSLMDALNDKLAEIAAATAYARGKAAIMAATTADDANAAYEAIDKNAITGAQAATLMDLLDDQLDMIATAGREADQKMALMDAAGMIDTSDLSTQDLVDAAKAGIVALRQALTNAVDVSDADKMMYTSTLNDAVDAVDMAQGGIDTDTRRANQMAALSSASTALQAALSALSGATPTQALLDDANDALDDLKMALTDGADLTDDEKAPYQREADNAAMPIQTAQEAFDDAEDEAGKADAAMMAATAAKLYAGIGAEPLAATGDGTRTAAYDATDNSLIGVVIGTAAAVNLSEDDDVMVADHYGWEGMMFMAEPDGDVGTYEAVVYSNVGEPTEGAKFNDTANGGYAVDATTGETADVTTLTGHAASRVASPSFDQSAGLKAFKPGENDVRIMLTGSYRGVPGTYYCTATDRAVGCTATVAEMGFTLAGGTWTFKPTNPEARFMDVPDAIYASYGWWIHTSEDGETVTVSAFTANRGAVPAAAAIGTLMGTATYMGGAAGKYALRSSTGGTNDAGHFTARAMLEADFGDDMITGTIDNFMGADGMARDWSVELMEQGVGDTGTILGDDGTGDAKMTTWTIGEMEADAAGQWSGTLYDNDDDNVPQVATGTFVSTFGGDGRMVGAFGANVQ